MAEKALSAKLTSAGQSHLLRFWDRLAEGERESLRQQIAGLNFEAIGRMRGLLASGESEHSRGDIRPAEVLDRSRTDRQRAARAGEDAIRAGKVGVILVAGGQGTRLGYEGPKGCFVLGPVSGASLFEIHARKVLALEQAFEAPVPFYIMTSAANDGATRDFFTEHDRFGLSAERVLFFMQGMWPALWPDGRIVMDGPAHIFMSPDGHGGLLRALREAGMLEDMGRRGVETLFYLQVDNPLVEIAEPGFIGLHRLEEAEMSVKVCEKRDPEEGLGVVVERDGRHAVVEYTELTPEQKHARGPDGRLLFRYGSVAVHVFALDFLIRQSAVPLPLHVAHKKVPYVGDDGVTVTPREPNAYKFEKFIFDVLPNARRVLTVPFAREDEFSPVKNGSGQDSPETARRDMVNKAARWLEHAGVEVPRTADGVPRFRAEIDPCFARSPETLRQRLDPGFAIGGDVLLREPAGRA
jgi:UDP-N-acetylglucosamine/UDP-N-acetylgalactosamine diphosphorylase